MNPRHAAIALLVLNSAPLALAQTAGVSRSVNWEAMIPAIREVLKTQSARNPEFGGAEEHYSPAISRTVDITGDGVLEALVYFGTGGASTDQMVVMQMRDHKPVLAMFRDRYGKVAPMVFLAGATVMHTDSVELLARHHAVHAIHYTYTANGKLDQCGGEVYAWNARSSRFDYNPVLTKSLTEATCRRIPKAVQ